MTTDPQSPYAILSAMLAPAFFLTATASLLLSANNRLARIIDRARKLINELSELNIDSIEERKLIERHIMLQRKRSMLVLRAGQFLYSAISCFVGTSLAVAGDAYWGYHFAGIPTIMASLGVLSLFIASILLAQESTFAVRAINEEMDFSHNQAKKKLG